MVSLLMISPMSAVRSPYFFHVFTFVAVFLLLALILPARALAMAANTSRKQLNKVSKTDLQGSEKSVKAIEKFKTE